MSLARLILTITLAAALLAPISAVPARAGSIKLSAMTLASEKDGKLALKVLLNNLGTDTARDITLWARVLDQEVSLEGPGELGPQKGHVAEASLPFAPPRPGSYPVLVGYGFRDANRQAYHGLSYTIVTRGKWAKPQATARLWQLELSRRGETPVVVESRASEPLAVELVLAVPADLEVSPTRQSLKLAPGGKEQLSATVRNLSAVGGASYPLLAFISYVQEGRQYCAVARNLVKVTSTATPLTPWRDWLVLAAVFLGGLVIGVQLGWWRARRRGRRG